jgi:hypothetical protein
MNKRISEMQKFAYQRVGMEAAARGYLLEASEHNARVQQVFAELIIKECATIARGADLSDIDGGDSAVLAAASDQITKLIEAV